MVDLIEIDRGPPVVAYPVVARRGASSGSQHGPLVHVVQIRGEVQGGADPTDRLLSPVEHQGAGRVVRRLRGATRVCESFEAINVARADGVQYLEDRTSSWEDRLQHEAVCMMQWRQELRAAGSVTSAQRQAFIGCVHDQEMVEHALREQIEP